MKILYLTDQLYLHGGVEKILSEKINHLIDFFGHEVIIVTADQQNKAFIYPLNKKAKHRDLAINYDRNKSYFSLTNLIKSLKHLLKLKALLQEVKPDIVLSVGFTPEQFFLPFVAGKIPTIKEIHFSGHILQNATGFLSSRNLMKYFFKNYSCVVVLNEDEKRYYPKLNTIVIPNFVDAIAVTCNRENTVIAAGRIAPVKQFDHLIKAWALISSDFSHWKLKIFGDGEPILKTHLKNLINSLGLENSVELMGATTLLGNEMATAKIYAMSSSTECFPMVLLEAQAQGLAVISYDCPNGPRNIIENYVDGVLTEDQNIAKLGEGLKELINNPEICNSISENAVINAKRFTSSKIMRNWDELFQKLKYDADN